MQSARWIDGLLTEMTAFHKPYLIINPAAGARRPKEIQQRFVTACKRYGWQGKFYVTCKQDNLADLVQNAIKQGFDLIMAAGGDGTVSEIASPLVNANVPLAIIPTGTANSLAAELGIPLFLPSAFDFLQNHSRTLMLDAMQVHDRHYFLNIGIGFSSAVMENTPRQDKRRFGFLAYIAATFRSLAGLQPYQFKLLVDGQKIRASASDIIICSGGLFGKLVNIVDAPIIPDDGEVDIFIIKTLNLTDYVVLAFYLLIGRPRSSRRVVYLKAAHSIEIDSNKKITVQGDGDRIGETPLKIQVIPAALPVLVPASVEKEHRFSAERFLKSFESSSG